MIGMELIKFIYDNNATEKEIVLGVQGYTADMHNSEDEEATCSITDDGRLLIADSCSDYSEDFKKLEWYKVTITETYERTFAIQAKSESDAKNKVSEAYDNGDIDLDVEYDNPINTEYYTEECEEEDTKYCEIVEGDD